MSFFKVLILNVACLLVVFCDNSPADEIRILLLRSVVDAQVFSSSPIRICDKDGVEWQKLASGRQHRFSQRAGKVNVGMTVIPAVDVFLRSSSLLKLNGRPYRGDLIIHVEKGKISVINEIEIEEYLYGVVPKEVSKGWSDEIIKAQAVLARTFAMNGKYKSKRGMMFDLDDSTFSQVYVGQSIEDARVNSLVDKTRGEVLMFKNRLAEVYYHSCCGGMTEDVGSVWGRDIPYLRSVVCDHCKESPNYRWEWKVSREAVAKKLVSKGKHMVPTEIRIRKLTKSRRVAEVELKNANQSLVMRGNEFRNIMGTSELRSLLFTVKNERESFVFEGRGWGHGIGLCQWGGKNMSDEGISYKNILRYYYRGTRLVKFSPALLR